MSERSTPSPDRLPISRFDYELPEELIAQEPLERRDASRLLVVERTSGDLSDRRFTDLPSLLDPGDLLIVNDTRVLQARLLARRATGGNVEVLLLRKEEGEVWRALARPARRLRAGEQLTLLDKQGELTGSHVVFVARDGSESLVAIPNPQIIDQFGRTPLPPYIQRDVGDPERYQTVYANEAGSAAAPTAGLHFTTALLDECRAVGIRTAPITLHVGLDTFRPVVEQDALKHPIHSEWYSVPAGTLAQIREARSSGGRVVAVGTTAVRTLETVADELESDAAVDGWSSLFITPPHDFKIVDAILTNFHLPRTTLLLLVSAFAGEDLVRRAYEYAIEARYRFYSFGDAMLIL